MARVLSVLVELDADEVVEVLHGILQQADAREPTAQELALLLVDLGRHEDELGYERIADIYTLAAERGYEDVQRLVNTHQAARTARDDEKLDNEFLPRTLGERKALAATTRDRNIIDRLMRDKSAAVIEKLLNNPQLVERDVVRIASTQPLHDDVIAAIVAHRKWITRYKVKKAVICNPYTRVNTALSLLSFMQRSDLREIASNTTLANEVRDAARVRVNEKQDA